MALVLTCYHLKKGQATFYQPKTIVASLLLLMVLSFKVIFNHVYNIYQNSLKHLNLANNERERVLLVFFINITLFQKVIIFSNFRKSHEIWIGFEKSKHVKHMRADLSFACLSYCFKLVTNQKRFLWTFEWYSQTFKLYNTKI